MWASGVISSVLPSGGADFTARLATMPTAPVLFSTTTVRPSETRILSAIRRVRVSLLAPGGKPSTSFSGLSAWAAPAPSDRDGAGQRGAAAQSFHCVPPP